jgi:hypothetical protein
MVSHTLLRDTRVVLFEETLLLTQRMPCKTSLLTVHEVIVYDINYRAKLLLV